MLCLRTRQGQAGEGAAVGSAALGDAIKQRRQGKGQQSDQPRLGMPSSAAPVCTPPTPAPRLSPPPLPPRRRTQRTCAVSAVTEPRELRTERRCEAAAGAAAPAGGCGLAAPSPRPPATMGEVDGESSGEPGGVATARAEELEATGRNLNEGMMERAVQSPGLCICTRCSLVHARIRVVKCGGGALRVAGFADSVQETCDDESLNRRKACL